MTDVLVQYHGDAAVFILLINYFVHGCLRMYVQEAESHPQAVFAKSGQDLLPLNGLLPQRSAGMESTSKNSFKKWKSLSLTFLRGLCHDHRLNMEVDLQSLFGLHVT
jgi:hypothetical protein